MSEVTITLPKLGESIVSAVIVSWFKKEGDPIKLDEPLLEVSTDKVNSEIPSPVSGTLKKVLANPDDELEVGAPLALIVTSNEALIEPEAPKEFFSPAVLRLAREKGLPLEELEKIPTSGSGGRLTKKDLEKYIETPKETPVETPAGQIKLTSMRKAIADNMVRSFSEAPHATLLSEVDVTPIQKEIRAQKESFKSTHGAKLTITTYLARAISKAAKEFPLINSTLQNDTITLKPQVNLGIAVSLDDGLIVPVIKNCHALTLPEIAKDIARLSERARTSSLSPDDVKEGTLTMTNFGMSGIMIGIPIIPIPEVAIIGVGAITKKVVPINEAIAIRDILTLSLTFDHRAFDGMYGCGFLNAVKSHLEA